MDCMCYNCKNIESPGISKCSYFEANIKGIYCHANPYRSCMECPCHQTNNQCPNFVSNEAIIPNSEWREDV